MFNKKEYAHRRELGLSGQGKIKPTITPKGEAVPYTNREGVETEYPNDLGHHMVTGRGLVNRRQAREKPSHTVDKTVAMLKRRDAKAAKVQRIQSGEHERVTKKKESDHDRE